MVQWLESNLNHPHPFWAHTCGGVKTNSAHNIRFWSGKQDRSLLWFGTQQTAMPSQTHGETINRAITWPINSGIMLIFLCKINTAAGRLLITGGRPWCKHHPSHREREMRRLEESGLLGSYSSLPGKYYFLGSKNLLINVWGHIKQELSLIFHSEKNFFFINFQAFHDETRTVQKQG